MQREISVVLRSFNDADYIGRALDAITRQTIPVKEIICLDNQSEDNTLKIIASYAPLTQLHTIKRGSYVPGKALNQGVEKAQGNTIIFLNADAIPVNNTCFETLLKQITDHNIVYARQIARADARTAVKYDYDLCFPKKPSIPSKRVENDFYSIVCSAATATLLKANPIPENIQYSEDTLWANQLRSKGISIRYEPSAKVEHSHNYTYRQAITRFKNEGISERSFAKQSTLKLISLIIISPLRIISSVLKDYQYSKTHNLPFGIKEFVYSTKLRHAQKYHKPMGLLK